MDENLFAPKKPNGKLLVGKCVLKLGTNPHTVDGRNPFAPRNETKVETITFVGMYVGGSNHSRVALVV